MRNAPRLAEALADGLNAALPGRAAVVSMDGFHLWDGLRRHFDLTLMLDLPEAVLRARLLARWRDFGYPPDEARRKAEANDLPNGAIVRHQSRPADFVLLQSE
jgi:hypothetical protein